jgi:hypothetical protein
MSYTFTNDKPARLTVSTLRKAGAILVGVMTFVMGALYGWDLRHEPPLLTLAQRYLATERPPVPPKTVALPEQETYCIIRGTTIVCSRTPPWFGVVDPNAQATTVDDFHAFKNVHGKH